jgi:hypothetical protein
VTVTVTATVTATERDSSAVASTAIEMTENPISLNQKVIALQ